MGRAILARGKVMKFRITSMLSSSAVVLLVMMAAVGCDKKAKRVQLFRMIIRTAITYRLEFFSNERR